MIPMFIYNSIKSNNSFKVETLKGFTIVLEKATNSENNQAVTFGTLRCVLIHWFGVGEVPMEMWWGYCL